MELKDTGVAAKLMSFDNDSHKFQEWLEERQQAHQRIGATLVELVDNGGLSVVEAAQAYASAGSAIDGYFELIPQGSPGTSFNAIEQLVGRSPVTSRS